MSGPRCATQHGSIHDKVDTMLADDIICISVEKTRESKLALWDRLPFHAEHFCDISLRSIDGQLFKAHRLVLSMASDPLFAMLSGGWTEGQRLEIPFDSSSETLVAFLDFIYRGSARVKKSVLPELLRLVHQWEVLPLQSVLQELLMQHMTPELCSSLIVDCEVLLVDDLDEMLEKYTLEHFSECVKTEQFGSWPLHRMIGLLRSDDLVAQNEEEVLASVIHWHRSKPGRDDATAALLQMVRFPLLAVATLQSLGSREGLTGLPGVVMARLASAAMKHHLGSSAGRSFCMTCDDFGSPSAICGNCLASVSLPREARERPKRMRSSFPYWWADFGCSIRGAEIVAHREPSATEVELEPWAVHFHGNSLFIIDGRDPCCVLQWPIGSSTGRVIVGNGSTLNGVNDLSDIIDIAVDSNGDLFVLDGQQGRIVRIHDGIGEVVGDGRLVLDACPRALFVGSDGSIYYIDEGGSRVQRYCNSITSVIAGGIDVGSEAMYLEDAEDLFVTSDGTLYVSDSGNHRIQKWSPGSSVGVTVAGGNGKGSGLHQLQHPVGLHVTEEGTIYIADYQNHRIMKWREGWKEGLVVAGGHGPDSGLHQLCEPIDVTLDSTGAIYVADNGNTRVVRWSAPCQAYEQMLQSTPFA